MTPEEVLREAAKLIRERGWFTLGDGWESGAETRLCAYLALDVLRGRGIDVRPAERLLYQRIGEASILAWNDRQTSVEPVLAAFEGTR